jgi:hypothetical protein
MIKGHLLRYKNPPEVCYNQQIIRVISTLILQNQNITILKHTCM